MQHELGATQYCGAVECPDAQVILSLTLVVLIEMSVTVNSIKSYTMFFTILSYLGMFKLGQFCMGRVTFRRKGKILMIRAHTITLTFL